MPATRRTFALAALSLPLAHACTSSRAHATSKPADARAKLQRHLARIHDGDRSFDDRVRGVSALFLGKTYKLSPLGEGADGDRDTDPICDFEKFDCVTYVEEVMALARHADLETAVAHLQTIRYDGGTIDYGKRQHITMAQWIPGNLRAGHLRDVTRAVSAKHARAATLSLTHAHYASDKGKPLMLKKNERPIGTFSVPILPVANLEANTSKLTNGTIITTIRTNRELVPYRASHVGLIVMKNGKPFVRHAHRTLQRVAEDPLARFLKRIQRGKKWPLSGFNLVHIRERVDKT